MLVFVGAKGAPGATTAMLAVASCWPDQRRRVLLEADPDGGVLAARFGLATEPGLVTLAAASRRSSPPGELVRHAAVLDGNTALVAGPPTAEQAEAALSIVAAAVAAHATNAADVLLVDAGRGPRPAVMPLVEAARAVLLVARPRLDQLQQLVPTYRALAAAGRAVGVALVGEEPYRAAEVARVLDAGAEAIWAVLPEDRYGAAVLNAECRGREWSLRRSPLLRAARGLADLLAAYCEPPTSAGASPALPGARPSEMAR